MDDKMEAQGLFDLFKLADRELIEKLLKLARAIKVEEPEPGIIRVSLDFKAN